MQILRNVRAAAGRHATVLLVELVIPDHDRDFPGKWADLEMLLNLGARERTAADTETCSAKPDSDDPGGTDRFAAQPRGGPSRVTRPSLVQNGGHDTGSGRVLRADRLSRPADPTLGVLQDLVTAHTQTIPSRTSIRCWAGRSMT